MEHHATLIFVQSVIVISLCSWQGSKVTFICIYLPLSTLSLGVLFCRITLQSFKQVESFFTCAQRRKLTYNCTSALITWRSPNLQVLQLGKEFSSEGPASSSVWNALSLLEGGAQGVQSGCFLPLMSLRGKRELAVLKAHEDANLGSLPECILDSGLCGCHLGEVSLPPEGCVGTSLPNALPSLEIDTDCIQCFLPTTCDQKLVCTGSIYPILCM